MAAQRMNKIPRSWIENNDAVYDDISNDIINGNVIRVNNDKGETLLLKKHEIADVLESILDKVIEQKDIDLYRKINTDLRKHINTNIEILDTETKKYFHDKIDKVAENIAVSMIDSEIERQVRERVEAKIEEMRKLL